MNKNKVLRQFCSQNIASIEKLIPQADAKLAAELQVQLASLQKLQISIPASDADKGADADETFAERVIEMFGQVQTQTASLTEKLSGALQSVASYEAKVKSGELVTKEIVTEMCAAATTKATTDATTATETKLKLEFAAKELAAKTILDRKAAVQTAGLPMPRTDEIFALAEPEFLAVKAEAEKRLAPFKDKFAPNSQLASVFAWCAAADLPGWEANMQELAATKGGRPFEPLAGGSGGNNNTSLSCAV